MNTPFQGFEAFASRFPNARIIGKTARASCPIHQSETSKSRTLALREAADGSVQVTCFAGCQHRDILAAVGLNYVDTLPDHLRHGHGQTSHIRPKFSGWPCLQTLDALLVEINICRICANRILDGQTLTESDHDTLRRAHHVLTEAAQRVSKEVRHG